jgi:altronate hydrolase
VTPVIKVASNTELAQRMPDIIDIDTGSIVRGESRVEEMGEQLFAAMITAASGTPTKAEQLGQDDFIPWQKNLTF